MLSKVRTAEGTEQIEAYTALEAEFSDADFGYIMRGRIPTYFCNEYAVLDTETSHDGDRCGWVYQWAFKFNGVYVYGRTPDEFITLLERLRDQYELNGFKKLIIYVHNLSYDIQYLKHYLREYDSDIKMLCTDSHSVLSCDVFGFRFLCSYRMSNMNLDLFSTNYADKYRKAVGEINYNIVRYQDTELTESDWYYMFSDVASQHDAIAGYLKVNGYDVAYKAPMTSTGFVRKETLKESEKYNWNPTFKATALTLEQYRLCKQAFMGGITIASYKYAGDTVENVGHKDFTSSYPARQMMDYFPVGVPEDYGEVESPEELDDLLQNYCCVFNLTLYNVELKAGITAPYIQSSKCIHLKNALKLNGKVVRADALTIAVTEIDYELINRQYDYDDEIEIDHMLTFERGEAPQWLKNKVMEYYDRKCKLKHSDPRLYMASKALLNAIYGMSATGIVREEYQLNEELDIEPKDQNDDTDEAQLNRFYASRNSFMSFQLGLYTTAHARKALIDMVEAVGYDNFLYCDTDSVFYIKSPEVEKRLSKMNANIARRAKKARAYIGDSILGVATDEAPIRRFRALHAKCYACEELGKDGEYHLNVTIAGIPKKSVKWIDGEPVWKTNAEELGDINNLEDGFTFSHCGGTRCIYLEQNPTVEDVNGHKTSYASSAIICNIEKVVSDTMFTVGEDYTILDIKQTAIL